MRFIRLTLSGFKRLGHNTFKTIEIQFTNYCLLILGANGIGKSTMMREISPLPGNKNDYRENGFKRVEVEHNGQRYLLETKYSSTVKCSFIHLDTQEELNPGGTQAVQIQLAATIFGYTQAIHNLLHNTEKFTEMAPKRRREWFISVSNIDYDFAIGIWNKLRDHQRDIAGSTKQLKKRLVEESSSESIDKEDLDRKIKLLESKIETLNKISTRTTSHLDTTKELINDLIKFRDRYLTSYKEYQGYSKLALYKSNDSSIEDYRDTLITNISKLDQQLSHITTELEQFKKEYETNKNALTKDQIEEELNTLSTQIKEIDNIKYQDIDRDDLLHFYHSIISWSNDQVPVSLIKTDEYNQLLQERDQLAISIQSKQEDISTLRSLVRIQQENKNKHTINCPNCSHEFIPGYSEDSYNKLIQEGKALRLVLDTEEPKYQTLVATLNGHDEYLRWVDSLKQLFSSPIGNRVKQLILEDDNTFLNGITSRPVELSNKVKDILDKVDYQLKINKDKNRANELRSLLEVLSNTKQLSSTEYEQAILDKEHSYKEISDKHIYYKSLLNYLNKAIEAYQNSISIKEEMKKTMGGFHHSIDEKFIHILTKGVEQETNLTKVEIGDLLKLQQKAQNRDSVIEFINTQISSQDNRENLLKLIIDTLSPSSGLIALGLSQFINLFLEHMNNIIKQIWSYPLEVNIPDIESNELNFKFPMKVGLQHELIDDVSLGSSGIQEVINLAFKLTALKSLKLENYPLFLDEFGASFDVNHRSSAVNVIKRIIEDRIHSQLFMVCHYESSYGGLSNIDICLLSPEMRVPFNNVNEYTQIDLD